MNKTLLDHIQKLSQEDKKTLSQKALKVSEEVGELAKVVLPFDNAAGTTHRFIEKGRILEESVDVILTAISMAYELGFSHDDIEDMMFEKIQKWQGIQAKEKKVTYPIPYEIHVTVDIKDCDKDYQKENKLSWEEKIQYFQTICGNAGVKAIVLDLEKGGEIVMKDVMTSSKFIGTNQTAYNECTRISDILQNAGLKVVRRKIETVPWHPAAPTTGEVMPKGCYFEAHLNCIISMDDKERLSKIASTHNSHLSKNFFKKLENGKFVNMITYREYSGTYDIFLKNLELLKEDLKKNDVPFEKIITEFSIYDTKVSHDFQWLNETK